MKPRLQSAALFFLACFFIVFAGCISKENEINQKLGLADQYINESEYNKADVIYNELIKKYPDVSESYVRKGNLLFEYKNDTTGAQELFERAVEKPDAGFNAYHGLGAVLSFQGEHQKALIYLEKAIALNDSHPVTHGELAAAYFATGEFEKGVMYTKKAFELNLSEDNKKTVLENSGLYLRLYAEQLYDEDFPFPQEFEDSVDYILSKDQSLADAHVAKGIMLLYSSEYTKAEEHYAAALQKNPTDAKAWAQMCELYYAKGEFLDARKACDTGVSIEGVDKLYYYSALIYFQQGRYTEAAAHIEKAIEFNPTKNLFLSSAGTIYIYKAGIHLERNESDQMATSLLRSIELLKDQTPLDAYVLLGEYYHNKKEYGNADIYLATAIQKIEKEGNIYQRRYIDTYQIALTVSKVRGDTERAAYYESVITVSKPSDGKKDGLVSSFPSDSFFNKTIYLLPMDIDRKFVREIGVILQDKFKFIVISLNNDSTPENAYDAYRDQYYAETINEYLSGRYPGQLFAITSKDITFENSNYVFGATAPDKKTGVISTYRFTNSFMKEPENESAFFKRVLVQAMATIGTTNGLSRPSDSRCALAYPHNLEEFNKKEPVFCENNSEELEQLYHNYSLVPITPEDEAAINKVYEKYGLDR